MAAEQELLIMEKWEGKATTKLNGVKAEQVWPLFLDDFCCYHKWLPTIDTCRRVEGVNGQPGLVRYCSSTPAPPSSDDDGGSLGGLLWCHEKLVAVDSGVRSLSYEILENNLGIKSCVTTIKVLPAIGGDDDQIGCQIQWSFVADPFQGLMTYDGFSAYVNFALQGMAEKMERALAKPQST